MTCQCLVIWGYVKHIIEFYNTFTGLASKDVAKWCKECHTCQLGGKPNQNIPQAPFNLCPIQVFKKSFSHIIFDCVGHCPKLSHKMIGNAKFVSTFDMLKGYWQVPLTQRSREISRFATPRSLYQYKVMPFGMKNAPATLQRI